MDSFVSSLLYSTDGLRSFVIRCNVGDLAKFEHSVRAWGRGSEYANLSVDQYAKLKRLE
jgi:hypothetical protein